MKYHDLIIFFYFFIFFSSCLLKSTSKLKGYIVPGKIPLKFSDKLLTSPTYLTWYACNVNEEFGITRVGGGGERACM